MSVVACGRGPEIHASKCLGYIYLDGFLVFILGAINFRYGAYKYIFCFPIFPANGRSDIACACVHDK